LLARQLLLERASMALPDAVEHLVGLQAQTPHAPYLGLWSRLRGFDPFQLAALLEARRVVRLPLMRSTVHLVSATDCLSLRPLFQDLMVKAMLASFRRDLEGVDLMALVAAGQALLDQGRPLSWAELGAALCERWPGHPYLALANVVRAHLALVQVPPRGTWLQGGTARHVTAETWLGADQAPVPVDDLVLRYLAAFGPASVADAQTWSGLRGLGEVFARRRDRLVVFAGPSGEELFDLPEAPRPDEATPAPPRFLPVFDNLLLSHADRSHVVTDDLRRRLPATAALAAGSVLVDGFVAAHWRAALVGGEPRVKLTHLAAIPAAAREQTEAEGALLASFLRPVLARAGEAR